MVDAGANQRKSQRNVDAGVEVERLKRNQTLIVVHANVPIGFIASPRQKRSVGWNGIADFNSLSDRRIDGRLDDCFFFAVAEQSAFASVRVEAKRR